MYFSVLLQLVIAGGLLNVWLLRFHQSSEYRGGEAKNLKEEFQAYGLPEWFFYLIGFLKVGCALGLIVSIWLPSLTPYFSSIIIGLMLGAIGMHIKVGDPLKKSVPAATLLILSVALTYFGL